MTRRPGFKPATDMELKLFTTSKAMAERPKPVIATVKLPPRLSLPQRKVWAELMTAMTAMGNASQCGGRRLPYRLPANLSGPNCSVGRKSDTFLRLRSVVAPNVTPLLSLHQHPLTHPEAWSTIEAVGVGTTVLLNIDTGPGSGLDPTWTTATQRLVRSGVSVLGYIDLAFGARAIEQVRSELGRWAGYPIRGIFFDQAPTSPYSIGPVAVAVRSARRVGYDTLLVNPGRPADSIYRGLGAVLCTFEGHWEEYREGTPDGVRHGDAHLVYSVPPNQIRSAHELMRGRGARFGLATTEASLQPVPA